MRLVQAGATLLMAGSLGLSAWSSPPRLAPPAAALTDPAMNEARARKAEMDIELAWLADAATFGCSLSAHCRDTVIELSGLVPNEPTRQRVIALAQQHAHLPVMDRLTVEAGSALPAEPCNRDILCRTAVTRLAKTFGKDGLAFDVSADAQGQITVAGDIGSHQQKLDVSRRLSQLPGCSAVINKLEVKPLAKGGRTYAAVTADSKVLLPVRAPAAAAKAIVAEKKQKAPAKAKAVAVAKKQKAPATAGRSMVLTQPTPQQPANVPTATAKKPSVTLINLPAAPAPRQPEALAREFKPTVPQHAQPAKAVAPPAVAPVQAAKVMPQRPAAPVQTAKAATPLPANAKPPVSLWSSQPRPAASAPASPYAMASNKQSEAKTPPRVDPAIAWTTPNHPARIGQQAVTAGTPSSPRPQGSVAQAGTPTTGPQSASTRSFVPSRATTNAAPSTVVSANLRQPANARPNVLPTNYQPADLPQPMPKGPVEAPPVENRLAAPRPLPQAMTPAPMPTTVAPVSATKPAESRPTFIPTKPAAPAQSPYASRPTTAAPAATTQVQTVQPMTQAKAVQPMTQAKAVQPMTQAKAVPVQMPRLTPPAATAAPRQMMPATANIAPRTTPAAPAQQMSFVPTRTAPKPIPERTSTRPTSPDITAGLLSHIRQRVLQVSAGRARDVQLQKVASDRLKITLKVANPQEGEELAGKVLAITELGPFQVDLEVQLGD